MEWDRDSPDSRFWRPSQRCLLMIAVKIIYSHWDRDMSTVNLVDDRLAVALVDLRNVEGKLREQSNEVARLRAKVDDERLRYRDLFQSIPDACVLLDAGGLILEVNRAALALFRRPAYSLLGKSLAAFVD